jgi:16S rRNA processing protein RimM
MRDDERNLWLPNRMPPSRPDLVLVGRFGAAHGVRGEIRLKSFTADPKAIAAYGPLTDVGGTAKFVLASLRLVKDDICVARVEGIGDRTAAERLTNLDLFVPRAQLPPPDADEFYQADLIGLAACLEDGREIGRIERVLDFGGGDILEIRRSAGGETLLVPFTRAAVPHVDIARGRVTIVPPAEIDGEAGG